VNIGDYLFVHPALRPDRTFEEQSPSDSLRYRSYNDEAPVWTQTVVHGHSPTLGPMRANQQIGLDTKAYESGVLTFVALRDGMQDFLQVRRPDAATDAVVVKCDLGGNPLLKRGALGGSRPRRFDAPMVGQWPRGHRKDSLGGAPGRPVG
jgi:hypothetical protein